MPIGGGGCTKCWTIGEATIGTTFVVGCKVICPDRRRVIQGVQSYTKKFDKAGTAVAGRVV